MKKIIFQTILLLSLVSSTLISCKGDRQTDEITTPDPTDNSGTDTSGTSFGDSLNYIFRSGTEGYSCFRIPAIVKAADGSLLAFAEARKNNCSDAGDIDMVLRRSTDNGKNWSDLIKVWDDGGNTCGNPSPVLDRTTGTLWLLMSWNLGQDNIGEINDGNSKDTRRVFVTHSEDNGLSWSAPREITKSVKRVSWGWYATGPCHGIQMTKGQYAGRLVVPCDYITLQTKEGSSHVIYSDDHGQSWQLGGIVQQGKVNESTVAELSDGTLMLNMRSGSGARMEAISNDSGESWSDAKPEVQLPDPTCQGSLFADKDRKRLFFSNPANSHERKNMTIKLSEDDGKSWDKSFQVYEGPSAYSDLVMPDQSHIAILYEAGVHKPYEGIAFKSIAVNDFQ